MKATFLKVIPIILLLLCAASRTSAQSASGNEVTIYLKNAALYPKKYTVVTYKPGETGNGTNSGYWLPGLKKRNVFPDGTKIYLATPAQVDIVMSGNSIVSQEPFLVVSKKDQNKTFLLK